MNVTDRRERISKKRVASSRDNIFKACWVVNVRGLSDVFYDVL